MSNEQLKAVSAYYVRAHSIKEDGYETMFAYRLRDSYFSKFVHRNGNRITLKLSLNDCILSQTTNGEEVFRDKVC